MNNMLKVFRKVEVSIFEIFFFNKSTGTYLGVFLLAGHEYNSRFSLILSKACVVEEEFFCEAHRIKNQFTRL